MAENADWIGDEELLPFERRAASVRPPPLHDGFEDVLDDAYVTEALKGGVWILLGTDERQIVVDHDTGMEWIVAAESATKGLQLEVSLQPPHVTRTTPFVKPPAPSPAPLPTVTERRQIVTAISTEEREVVEVTNDHNWVIQELIDNARALRRRLGDANYEIIQWRIRAETAENSVSALSKTVQSLQRENNALRDGVDIAAVRLPHDVPVHDDGAMSPGRAKRETQEEKSSPSAVPDTLRRIRALGILRTEEDSEKDEK